jgi:hypothetical protein
MGGVGDRHRVDVDEAIRLQAGTSRQAGEANLEYDISCSTTSG